MAVPFTDDVSQMSWWESAINNLLQKDTVVAVLCAVVVFFVFKLMTSSVRMNVGPNEGVQVAGDLNHAGDINFGQKRNVLTMTGNTIKGSFIACAGDSNTVNISS